MAKMAEFRTAMDGMMATVESTKAAYQKINQDLADAEGNIAALTNRLDDALNTQAITSTVLQKANKEKKELQLSSQSEISAHRTDLEASVKVRSMLKRRMSTCWPKRRCLRRSWQAQRLNLLVLGRR
ncbi:hypothetical protein Adt_18153 [Abeliophyllum distichum]|uniref:Uncharacterized protein n=1 Tax=Abeliophyllum distichum TaxID=126358 RepID=A0ABD1TJ29_9LAMI